MVIGVLARVLVFVFVLVVGVLNGKLIVTGGLDTWGLSSVEQYNEATNKWTPLADMNTKRSLPATGDMCVCVSGGGI